MINDNMIFKTIVLSTYDIFANRIVNTIVEKRLKKNNKKKKKKKIYEQMSEKIQYRDSE
jgi:cytidylate kinase